MDPKTILTWFQRITHFPVKDTYKTTSKNRLTKYLISTPGKCIDVLDVWNDKSHILRVTKQFPINGKLSSKISNKNFKGEVIES